MRTVHIVKESSNSLHKKFLSAVEKLRKSPRIFYFYHHFNGTSFTLMTTSKDIKLGLGQMSEEALSLLCQILDEEFGDGKFEPVFFTVSKPDDDPNQDVPRQGILVTSVEKSQNKRVFQLAKPN